MIYNEIFRLKEMLEQAGIPFEFANRTNPKFTWAEKWQIGYPVLPPSSERVCSVLEGFGTYGAEDDKLEIMGLLTPKEEKKETVAGWLTAEDVFMRIKKHYEETDNG